ncbi:MAG: hypothetical protein ABJD11_15195 [Gemmatimonadota bacterium]
MSPRPAVRRLTAAAAVLGILAAASGCNNNVTGTMGGVIPPHDVLIVAGASTAGNLAFAPTNFTTSVAAGGSVRWANGDVASSGYGSTGVTHHPVSDTPLFDTGNIAPFGSAHIVFTTPGTVTYHCAIHPSMTGTITVNP